MFDDTDTVTTMKSRRISRAGHVWRDWGQVIGQVTKWIPECKIPLSRPKQRWVDKIKKFLTMLDTPNGENGDK